jgi:hypothetical protein
MRSKKLVSPQCCWVGWPFPLGGCLPAFTAYGTPLSRPIADALALPNPSGSVSRGARPRRTGFPALSLAPLLDCQRSPLRRFPPVSLLRLFCRSGVVPTTRGSPGSILTNFGVLVTGLVGVLHPTSTMRFIRFWAVLGRMNDPPTLVGFGNPPRGCSVLWSVPRSDPPSWSPSQ